MSCISQYFTLSCSPLTYLCQKRNVCFIFVYRPPSKVRSQLHPKQRKSSKSLEATFEATQTAAAGSDPGPVKMSECCRVADKQRSSTPVDHNANELHCPPASSCSVCCVLL